MPCDEVDVAAPLRLFLIPPYSPSDRAHRDENFGGAGYNSRTLGIKGDLYNARFAHSYLRLNMPPAFPRLNRVSRFVAAGNGPRYLAPGPLFLLLENMRQVDDLTLRLYDNEKKKSGLRRRLRIEFGKALGSSCCSVLKTFRLDNLFEEPSDHRFKGTDVRVARGKAMHDDFSLGLHQFISSCPVLEDVQLGGPMCVDETLFWSPECDKDDGRWPSLKHFHVEISCFRPDGGWYLDEHPDFPRDEPCRQIAGISDSDSELDSIDSEDTSIDATDDPTEPMPSDEDDNAPADTYGRMEKHREALRTGDAYILYFRSGPTEALERIWVAAAQAAAAMPKLCTMSVSLNVSQCPRTEEQPQEFSFAYGAEDSTSDYTGNPVGTLQLDWTAPHGWNMSENLQTPWRRVLGPEGEVVYEHW